MTDDSTYQERVIQGALEAVVAAGAVDGEDRRAGGIIRCVEVAVRSPEDGGQVSATDHRDWFWSGAHGGGG